MCMKEIDELTDKVIALCEVPVLTTSPCFKEYNLKVGIAMSWTIYKSEGVHIMRSYLSKDAIFPLHEHETSVESLIVYDGSIEVIYEDLNHKEIVNVLNIGESITLLKGVNHKIHSLEESKVVAILIPPESDSGD